MLIPGLVVLYSVFLSLGHWVQPPYDAVCCPLQLTQEAGVSFSFVHSHEW